MKKLIFQKDHLDKKAGDKMETSEELANYLIAVGVAKEETADRSTEKEFHKVNMKITDKKGKK